MDPAQLCSSPSVLQIYLVFNWSILNDNINRNSFIQLFFEFRFAAFPGKTIRSSITGKIPATLILAGGDTLAVRSTLRVLLATVSRLQSKHGQ